MSASSLRPPGSSATIERQTSCVLAGFGALSVADQMQHDLALVSTAAMLEEIDTLPGSKRHVAGAYRDGQVHAGERGAQVCRHVVRPFVIVLVAARIFRR